MVTISNFLDPDEIQMINSAVTAAEKNTSGEIKPLVVQSSVSFPGETDEERTWSRANDEFFILGLDHTQDHTGILIMISLDEHRVEVRAGQSINEFYEQDTWQTIVDAIIAGVENGIPSKGIVDAIVIAGEILSEHFPIKPDDINEISDEIIFKE